MRLEDMSVEELDCTQEDHVSVEVRSMQTAPTPQICSIDNCGQEN